MIGKREQTTPKRPPATYVVFSDWEKIVVELN